MPEEFFGRSMLPIRGSFLTFCEHPISATLLAALGLFIAWQIFATLQEWRAALATNAHANDDGQ